MPATTLRFYETAGLLLLIGPRPGTGSTTREAVDRLEFIRAAKHLGLPLDEVAELLAVWQSGACVDVKADLRPRLVARLADAEVRAAELASFIATLQRAQQRLDSLPDRTGRCDPACGLPSPTAPPVGEQQLDRAAPAGEERWRNASGRLLSGRRRPHRAAATVAGPGWRRPTSAHPRRTAVHRPCGPGR